MTSKEAKGRVLAVYPDARLTAEALEGWCIYEGGVRINNRLTVSHDTEDAAWIDAAAKLQAAAPPAPKETPMEMQGWIGVEERMPKVGQRVQILAEDTPWEGPYGAQWNFIRPVAWRPAPPTLRGTKESE